MDRRTLKRFEVKVARGNSGGCWLWTASVDQDGYGWFRDGSIKRAHRVSYEHYVGPIDPNLTLDHLCENPPCVNPDHLEAVPASVNVARGDSPWRRKTHCPQGHPYNEENTRVSKHGWRYCRACSRERKRRKTPRRVSGEP